MATAKILPFGVSDLLTMDVQERHAWMLPHALRNLLAAEHAMVGPWSWTMWSEYGIPLGAAGILRDGGLWAFLGPGLRPYMLRATREARRGLESYVRNVGPTYAEVDKTHPEALRWVKLLGFRQEGGERWVFDLAEDAR